MFDRNFLLNALKQAKGNISLAAKVTRLTRPTLYDMMKKNGITVPMEAKMEERPPEPRAPAGDHGI